MPELEILRLRRLAHMTLDGQPMTIGRSSRNDVVLPHRAVSRVHCEIRVVDGVARLADAGSTRGTRVNGARVTEAVLRDGDRIKIGPFELIVRGLAGAGVEDGGPGEASEPDPASGRGDPGRRRARTNRRSREPSGRRPDDERERSAADRSSELEDRGRRLDERERSAADRDSELEDRGRRLDERERSAADRDSELEQRAAILEARGHGLDEREATTAAREQEVARALDEARARHEAAVRDLHGRLETACRERDAERQRAAALDPVRDTLRAASRRLVETQRSVATLETAFAETDAWLADARAEGCAGTEIERVVRQRDALGEHLATAMAERDEAIAEVVQAIARDV